MNKLFILIIILLCSAYPQREDAETILHKVRENFDRVEDYQVNVNIKVDVEFMKVPDMNATLYFKQPDKMQLDSKEFAMLPRGGMNFSPSALLRGKYTSYYEKDTLDGGVKIAVIKVIPLEDKGDIVLSTLRIDLHNYRILRVESTTKTQGTFIIDLIYPRTTEYPLPSAMTFSFNLDKMDLPKGMSGELNTAPKKEKESRVTTGKVFVTYSDYKINKGISDKLFKDAKK